MPENTRQTLARRLSAPENGLPNQLIEAFSMDAGVFSNRRLEPAKEQRRAAARAALDEMEGHHGSVAWIDDRLDFLAEEISEQMMQELVRTWIAFKMGYPTSSKLAALAETIYLQAAVAALDG